MLIERGIFLGNELASLYGLKNEEYYPFVRRLFRLLAYKTRSMGGGDTFEQRLFRF